MPGTLLSNGAEAYPLSSDGLSSRQMSQRLRALMLGTARALNDGLGQNRAFAIQIASKTFRTRLSPTLVRTLQNVTTTVIAPLHGTMRCSVPSNNRFPAFWRRVHQLQHDKLYWLGTATSNNPVPLRSYANGPASTSCSPFGRQRTAGRLVGSQDHVCAACEHLRLATVSNSAVAR
jgi:hypothetical protein